MWSRWLTARSPRFASNSGSLILALRSQSVAAADHFEHDLVGAGTDAVQPHVAVGALDLVFLHIAIAAHYLDALVGDLAGHARREQLHLGDLADRVFTVGVPPRDHVVELLRGLDLG